MLLELTTATLLAFINPADPTGMTTYPGGEKEIDHIIFNTPPATKNPLLKLSEDMCTSKTKCLDAGVYEVTLSGNNNFLILWQGKDIKAKIPIFELTTLTQPKLIPLAQKVDQNTGYVYFIYEKDNQRAIGVVKTIDK